METVIERTTQKEQGAAKKSLASLNEMLNTPKKGKKPVKIDLIDDKKVHLELPDKVFRLLQQILEIMAAGKAFSLIPSDSMISTKQAAELLNVSRPHIVKLLESGQIPFTKVGTHRRIRVEDFLAYKKKMEKKRSKALDKLAAEAQDLEMGY